MTTLWYACVLCYSWRSQSGAFMRAKARRLQSRAIDANETLTRAYLWDLDTVGCKNEYRNGNQSTFIIPSEFFELLWMLNWADDVWNCIVSLVQTNLSHVKFQSKKKTNSKFKKVGTKPLNFRKKKTQTHTHILSAFESEQRTKRKSAVVRVLYAAQFTITNRRARERVSIGIEQKWV